MTEHARPLTTAEYHAALIEVGELLDAEPGSPEWIRLGYLPALIEEYEARHFPTAADPIFIRYKGYLGRAEYQKEAGSFAGHIVGVRGAATFRGASREEAQREMAASIDQYLELCAEQTLGTGRPRT